MDVPVHNQIPTQLLINAPLFSLGDTLSIVHEFTGPWHPVWTTNIFCKKCSVVHRRGSKQLIIASDKYFDALSRDSRSWPINVVKTFAWLMAHEEHKHGIIFDDSDEDDDTFGKRPINVRRKGTESILSLATKDSHYVLIEIKVKPNVAVVYDGFSTVDRDLQQWMPHIDRLMSRYGLSRINDRPHWIIRHPDSFDFRSNFHFTDEKEIHRGPIACRMLWEKLAYKAFIERGGECITLRMRMRKSIDPDEIAVLCMREMKELIAPNRERSIG